MHCPEGYKDVFNNSIHCFKQIKENKTWPSAQKTCNDDGGNLVCFETQEEREFWKDNCDKCWSGYNRIQGIKDMKNRIHTSAICAQILFKNMNESPSSQIYYIKQVFGLQYQTVVQITSALMT